MADNERKHAACRECREKKLKCMPSEDGGDACHRCTRLGKECQVPEIKLRKRKARLRGRVEQLENSYTEILSLLKQRPLSEHHGVIHSSGSTPSMAEASQKSHPTAPSSSSWVDPPRSDMSGSRFVEMPLDECERLMHDYTRMSTNNFPWVLIPDAYPAATLLRDRPMLAQAVFIATTSRYPERQRALVGRFLQDFTERYWIKAERSLDLLQAVMVYLAWCHWHAIPVATQVYRWGSIVVSLTHELGINQKPASTSQHEMIVGGSGLDQDSETVPSKFWNYEARRAYIGAYVLSTFGLILFKKPSVLSYTQHLEDCATSLATDPQQFSDTLLIYNLQTMHFAADITYTFDHGSREKIAELSDEKIQILVRAFSKQLEEWKASLRPGMFNTGRVQRSYYNGIEYLHEVGMYGLLQGQTPSVTRLSMVYECFEGAIKYLSVAAESTLEEMSDWMALEWRALNYTIMVATKSSIVLASTYSKHEANQRATWLNKLLETLCLRAQELHVLRGEECSYFLKLARDWASVNTYHQNSIQKPSSSVSTADALQPPIQSAMQPQPRPTNTAYMANTYDMDPFSELFWAGFGDVDPNMTGIYSM